MYNIMYLTVLYFSHPLTLTHHEIHLLVITFSNMVDDILLWDLHRAALTEVDGFTLIATAFKKCIQAYKITPLDQVNRHIFTPTGSNQTTIFSLLDEINNSDNVYRLYSDW